MQEVYFSALRLAQAGAGSGAQVRLQGRVRVRAKSGIPRISAANG